MTDIQPMNGQPVRLWEKILIVATGAWMGWELYGLLRCPICRAEAEKAGSRRVVDAHRKHRESPV